MRGPIVRSLVSVVVVVGFLVGQLGTAQAVPTPTPRTVAEARKLVQQLDDQASEIGENYAAASDAVTKAQAKVDASKKAIAEQEAVVDALTQQAREIALTQFQHRDISTTLQLFTSSDPETFLSQLSTVNKVNQNMNDQLQQQQLEQATLTDMQRALDADLETLTAEKKRQADLKAQIDKKLAETKALLAQLTEEQRAALAQADGPSVAPSSYSKGSNSSVGVTVSGEANERATAAAQWAISKVGNSSYVWGGSGPNGFDCSGLMMASYRTVGVSLPHSSAAQARMGRAVSLNELRPGDLLFWYSPIHHVSMYIGNGMMVHAANSRLDLRIQSVSSYGAPFAGARRILG